MTSTMLPVKVDRSDPRAFPDQVAGESDEPSPTAKPVRGNVFRWRRHGSRTGVNKNTVLRALHILRDEGLLASSGDGGHRGRDSRAERGDQPSEGAGRVLSRPGLSPP
jgi:hypothetical protein